MGTLGHACKLSVLILLVGVANPSAAQVPPLAPLTIEAKYIVAWNGITIGRINLTAEEAGGRYRMLVDTKTRGLARLFSDEATVASAEGAITDDGRYIPLRFESRPLKDPEKPRTVLTYDEAGKLLSRERTPDDDPAWRPPVPPEQVATSTDPVSAGFILRRMLHDNMAREVRESVVTTYEGARLADMKFTVVSRARVEYMDEYHDAINTVVTRVPIAGYTVKEKKKYAEGDPTIHLYFSADSKLIPVKATVDLAFGQLSATLTEIK